MSTLVSMIPLAVMVIILTYCAFCKVSGAFTSESVLLPLGFIALLSVPSAGIWSYFNGTNALLITYGAICAIFFVIATLFSVRLGLVMMPIIAILISIFAVAYLKLDVDFYRNLLLGCCFSGAAIGITSFIGILSFHHQP